LYDRKQFKLNPEAQPFIIVDAHQDIAYNHVSFGRDFSWPALKTRQSENNSPGSVRYRGLATLGLPDALLGRVGLIFATLYVSPAWSSFATPGASYETPQQAYQMAMRQLDYYKRLADSDERVMLVRSQRELNTLLDTWREGTEFGEHKLGLVVLMEGADPILEPAQLEEWFYEGVRIIGPAWSETRYAGGTGRPGPLTSLGFELLERMADRGMILDLSHLAEEAYFQAIDRYEGTLIASHSNPRNFLDSDRMLSDEMIMRLAERDGVIGVAFFNRFIDRNWASGMSRDRVTLRNVTDIIDYICQLTGSARHVGIGTDLDGGFGAEAIPYPIDTISDLWLMRKTLEKRGYAEDDVKAILSGNFLRMLFQALPESES
jgi:membrane dipeptidase